MAVSVAGLRYGSSVLAWRRPCGGYTMPGGKLDEGDRDILQCASREAREECNVDIPYTAWKVLATSTRSEPGRTYLLVLCATKLETCPTNFDPESLGMEKIDLLSSFRAMEGNDYLLDVMKEHLHGDVGL